MLYFLSVVALLHSSAASPECVVLLGLIGSMPVAVKRITLALYQPMKENFVKLIQSKYTQECLVKYLVRLLHLPASASNHAGSKCIPAVLSPGLC